MDFVFQLVTWNGADIVGDCLKSLDALAGGPYRVAVVDNNSEDATNAIVAAWAAKTRHRVTLLHLPENTGFAQGHNRAFRMADEPIVCLLNQDILLAPEFAMEARAYLDNNPAAAGISPLLFVLDKHDLTDRVDTAGLEVMPSGRVVEWKGGVEWRDGLAQEQRVFGASGACPIFRRTALVAVAEDGNVFDPRFGSYKEDVDLAWRLHAANMPVVFVPSVQAWHRRSARGTKESSDTVAAKNRKTKSARTNALSWRNHWFVLLKSVPRSFWKKNWPRILWYEGKKFLWICLFERTTLREAPAVFQFYRFLRKHT